MTKEESVLNGIFQQLQDLGSETGNPGTKKYVSLVLDCMRSNLGLLTTKVEEKKKESKLQEFASLVLSVIKETSPLDRWYGDRVFIIRVWKARDWGMTREQFNKLLLAANRERLLSLSRADMNEAMNRQDVLDSQISYLSTSFHFIESV